MAQARHAGSERKLLAADPIRQRLEQRWKTLRAQTGAAASQLGKAFLAARAAPERCDLEIEREEARDERFDRVPILSRGRGRVEIHRRSALPSAKEGRPLGEHDRACPDSIVIDAIDQI